MALVGDYQIKGVDRNVQLLGVLIKFLVPRSKNGISTKEVNGHPLNCADVHEGVTCIRVRQVSLRKHLRIVLLILVEVATLEPLAVDLIDFVELQPQLSRCPDAEWIIFASAIRWNGPKVQERNQSISLAGTEVGAHPKTTSLP